MRLLPPAAAALSGAGNMVCVSPENQSAVILLTDSDDPNLSRHRLTGVAPSAVTGCFGLPQRFELRKEHTRQP